MKIYGTAKRKDHFATKQNIFPLFFDKEHLVRNKIKKNSSYKHCWKIFYSLFPLRRLKEQSIIVKTLKSPAIRKHP